VPQNGGKQHNKPVFWLFWTISPERMDLMILLGAYFYAETFCHTSRLSVGICVPFMIHIEVPKQLQNKLKKHKKPVFWLFKKWP
jgi:polyferredoxin